MCIRDSTQPAGGEAPSERPKAPGGRSGWSPTCLVPPTLEGGPGRAAESRTAGAGPTWWGSAATRATPPGCGYPNLVPPAASHNAVGWGAPEALGLGGRRALARHRWPLCLYLEWGRRALAFGLTPAASLGRAALPPGGAAEVHVRERGRDREGERARACALQISRLREGQDPASAMASWQHAGRARRCGHIIHREPEMDRQAR